MDFVANLLFSGEMQGLWRWPVVGGRWSVAGGRWPGQGRAARQELRGSERQAAVLTAGPAGLRGGLAPLPAGAGTKKLVVDHSL